MPSDPLVDAVGALTKAVNIQTTWLQAQDDRLRRIHFWVRWFGVAWVIAGCIGLVIVGIAIANA